MADDKKTSEEDDAGALIGDEIVRVSIPGTPNTSARTTTQAIADLGGRNSAAYNDAAAFDAYGDSITVGFYASNQSTTAYIALLAASRGWTVTNHAVGNSMVMDQTGPIFQKAIAAGSQCTLMLGTNDMRTYQGNVGKRAAFKMGHMALAAWLAIPDANKTYGRNGTKVGTWANSGGNLSTTGGFSSTSGATNTFTVYGTTVYVCMAMIDPSVYSATGAYTVTIDGVVYSGYTTLPGGSASILSVLGETVCPVLLRFPGLSEGAHTVVVTASSTDPVVVAWVAANQGNRTKDGPNVWVGNTPRMNATGYSGFGGSDADVAAWNQMIRSNIDTLAGDGLNVALVDLASQMNTTTDLYIDGLHPDDDGHAVIAAAFEEAINQIQKPGTVSARRDSAVPINHQTGTTYTLALADVDHEIELNNGSAITLTVPRHINCPLEIGTVIPLVAYGAGQVTVAGASSVTVNATPGLKLTDRYSSAALHKRGPDLWNLVGRLSV